MWVCDEQRDLHVTIEKRGNKRGEREEEAQIEWIWTLEIF